MRLHFSLCSFYVLVPPLPPSRHRHRQSTHLPFLSHFISFSIFFWYLLPLLAVPDSRSLLSSAPLLHFKPQIFFHSYISFSWPAVVYRSLFVHFYQMMTVTFSVLVLRLVKNDDSNHVQCSTRRLLWGTGISGTTAHPGHALTTHLPSTSYNCHVVAVGEPLTISRQRQVWTPVVVKR